MFQKRIDIMVAAYHKLREIEPGNKIIVGTDEEMKEIYKKNFKANICTIIYIICLRVYRGFFFGFKNILFIAVQYTLIGIWLYAAFAYPNEDDLDGNTPG